MEYTKQIPGKVNVADRGCKSQSGCLTRTTSDRKVSGTVANLNYRAAIRACKKLSKTGFVKPSCDEYPFASTHEGSAHAGKNYSVAIVEKSDNCSGGSKLGNWYLYNRILEKDPFWVYVIRKGETVPPETIPSDGPEPHH
ncbi:NucA/NucB deoxyribonuclease domain-containing protein [Acrocarpospora catenulata]|uniref:NucA/NucB deoxyribonuclease domain-containing protein n=1 Tax=Acrocarpospora catenulata TaxID=2836182 RepID=UPI001BDA14F0|nr:NucA/NucB deoxyribonuclease domain-containing protein [Acrocarpospora catenulata]